MKKLSALLICLLAIIMISCQKDEVKTTKQYGSLHIDIGLFISVHNVNNHLKSTSAAEDLKVVIYRSDGTEVISFESGLIMPDVIELETGNYYAEAHSDNNLPAAFENPYYFGASEVFTINSNTQETVVISAELANTIVTVTYSDVIMTSFSAYTTTVSSTLGSLQYAMSETRMGYFQTMPLDILVELTYEKPDGTANSKTLSGSIPNPFANRHYEVRVDASIDEGMATFQVILDETTVLVEVVNLTDESAPPPAGAVGYGELLITEIMYNPSALSDSDGEWFEIYNNSDHNINLQNLILGRDDANRHTITESIELLPGAFHAVMRNVLALNITNSYLYGSDISLSNTGALLSIFNEGTETNPGALIFSINYGEANFPDAPGVSISLNPDLYNVTVALLGTSWCLATSIYGTGDAGTPGAINDICQ